MGSDDEMFNDKDVVATEARPGVATPASLPMNEIQLRIAQENPRDEGRVAEQLKQELAARPDYAEDGFYFIPRKNKKKGLLTFVDGLSIRCAEHIWTRWGRCTVAARVADDRGEKLMVQGMFFDYQTGLLLMSDMEVSKRNKGRDNYLLDSDMLALTVASASSKVKRNAFLGGIPPWIREDYLRQCQDIALAAGSKSTVPERIKKASEVFITKYKLKADAVETLIAKIKEFKPGCDDSLVLRYLIGTNNALKAGDISVDFVFGEDRAEEKMMPKSKSEAAKK